MMRTEIHLRNPDGKLSRGMYGNVTINLQPGVPSAVRIPTTALTAKGDGGKGTVRVVRNGKVQSVDVTLGTDNGVEVEVLAGLAPTDQVIKRAGTEVEDGADVSVSNADSKPSSAH